MSLLMAKTSLAFVGLNLLTALSLAVAQAQAQKQAPAQNLLVANQSANTIQELSPSGADLGNFVSTGLNPPLVTCTEPSATYRLS